MGKRKGFTLIEVVLFLGVTAMLFLGVAIGVSNSLFQQQYNDSVFSFLEFMRSVYSKVSNPQSLGAGDSEYAIYGKMIVFGENTNLKGDSIAPGTEVFTYDVIGATDVTGTGDIMELFKKAEAGVALVETDALNNTTVNLVSPERYVMRWEAGIETTASSHVPVKRTMLVVRHPRSSTINTLVWDAGVIEVNEIIKNNKAGCEAGSTTDCNAIKDLLKNNVGRFEHAEVDFCINPYGLGVYGGVPRQDIRVLLNARNAAAVELIDLDGNDNKCL